MYMNDYDYDGDFNSIKYPWYYASTGANLTDAMQNVYFSASAKARFEPDVKSYINLETKMANVLYSAEEAYAGEELIVRNADTELARVPIEADGSLARAWFEVPMETLDGVETLDIF